MTDPFPTTQWTVFLGLRDGLDPEGRRLALEHLYERYWQPLYAYLRRRGFNAEQSADLLQGFFVHLLEREYVERLDLEGRLRAFLLGSLKHFIADELAKERAHKRSPRRELLSLDTDAAEQAFRQLPSVELNPEQAYERQWAAEMMQRAQRRLRRTETSAGRGAAFERLAPSVFGEPDDLPYAEVAAALDITEAATRVRVHRLRKRLGRMLREDIALTVVDAQDVDEELRHLIEVIA